MEDQEKQDQGIPEEKSEQSDKNNESNRGNSKRRFYNRNRRYSSQQPQWKRENLKFNKASIIIPLLNEEESLVLIANEIRKILKPYEIGFEVFFVDDGSTDNSLKVIKEICRTDKRFKFLSFRKNYGKSAALQVGFKNATGDVVITMDADLQDDPGEIPNLLRKLNEGFDLVSGWKKVRRDPFIKKYSSRFFNFVTRVISGIKIHDFNCGLKAYRKEVIDNVYVYGELHRYIPVLAHWQGYKISEVVVKHHARRYGKTKFGISRFFKGFIDLITVIFTTRYVRRPMHLFGFLGALSFIAGIFVNGYLTYLWVTGGYLSNRPMLFLGILLIIVGVQFFSVGLLGEMFVHNTRSEKEYIIKDKG
ncbi:MAG TPA: glycosyltransferase family 2 protein [Ignavibacteriaceae bacterium]|nr:glycosyltransferase family 2 protein [Ignavibacteriaceae bacterium]